MNTRTHEHNKEKRLFLLDAYALIFRAYYAFIRNPRVNSKGMNTSAIFGFTNSLAEILTKEKPTHIAVVFDTPAPTFRHETYKEYKANREATPEDIRSSVPYIKDIIRAFNIPIIEAEGYEADDIIGTLAKKAEKEGYTTYMMTPDKDFGQLVSDSIFMYVPKRGGNENAILGVPEIQKIYNIKSPEQVVDIFALWGDSSDNIPGAPGIGEKTSKKLISEYGSLENLYKNIDDLKGKQKENILNFKNQIELSRFLVTIALDAPVEFNGLQLKMKDPDKQALGSIFEELEFRNLAKRILEDNAEEPSTKTVVKDTVTQGNLFDTSGSSDTSPLPVYDTIDSVSHDYHLTDTSARRKELISKLKQQKDICFDTETTGIDANNCELVGIAFSFKAHEGYYVPFPEDQDEAKKVANEFREIFENENIRKTGQNLKFDIIVLKWYDINVYGDLFDTMIAHYLIHPESRHNLEFLSEQYLNYTPVAIESLIGKKGKDQLSMRSVAIEKVSEYACEDADLTWQLKGILEKRLKDNNINDLFYKLEMPLVNSLATVEKNGVTVSVDSLNSYSEILRKDIRSLEEQIYMLAGIKFNISSPKQLGEVLFDRMKIDTNAKKTKTKQYSTSEEVLVKLKSKHEIIDRILDYRSLTKLLSTYVEALPKLINPRTGKVHTSFNQAITSTGRLSSNNPNLQNIPVREERGREIRKAFTASDKEHILLSADYSQIELRLMAHFSEDPNMIDAFNKDLDIHTITAAKIHKVDNEKVTRDMRARAKTANFGIIYGISAFGLSQRLNISRHEAKQLIDSYFDTYPMVKEYMDKSIRFARDKGYVETIMGRRRYLKDINSRNAVVRGFAERNAINAPIQGSAADIIKKAMINICNRFRENRYKSGMILQVHDELLFDTLITELEEIKDLVRTEMQNAVRLSVDLTVDIGTGSNWLEAH